MDEYLIHSYLFGIIHGLVRFSGIFLEKLGLRGQEVIQLTLPDQYTTQMVSGYLEAVRMVYGGLQTERLGLREQEVTLMVLSTQYTMQLVSG